MHVASRRAGVLVAAALALAAPRAAAQPSEGPAFDPQRRVHVGAGVLFVSADALDDALRRLTALHYHVVVTGEGREPLLREAHALYERWRAAPGFDAERTVLILCATRPVERVAVVLPRSLSVRLAVSPRVVERLVADHFNSREGLAGALAKLAQRLDGRLEHLDRMRAEDRLRAAEARTELEAQVAVELDLVAARLADLDLRCLELREGGLDPGRIEERLQELRRVLADGLERHRQTPELSVEALGRARAGLAQAEAELTALEGRRRQASSELGALRGLLDEVFASAAAVAASPRAAAALAAEAPLAAAREALELAEGALRAGRPEEALDALATGRARLEDARRALAPPAAPPPRRGLQTVGIALGALFGLAALAAGGGLLGRALRRGQVRARAADLRRVSLALAEGIDAEVAALRAQLLEASRPVAVGVPAALREGAPLGAPPRTYVGETARALEQARGRVEELARMARQLRVAVRRSDALAAAAVDAAGEVAALRVLEAAGVRRLPVGPIRAAAHLIERVGKAVPGCAAQLELAASAVAEAEAEVSRALEAGQGPQPFDDDLADVVERARVAALAAPADPVRASLLAAEAGAARERLTARVERTLALAQGVREAQARLDALGLPPRQPDPARDLEPLVAWCHHVIDDLAQALDEGARDEAMRDLDRVHALVRDAELLARGAAGDAGPELALLREDLHAAREALDAMRAEFHPAAWSDVEVELLRAAARIELVAEQLREQGHVPRLPARLHAVRTASLLATTRVLQLRGERERAKALLGALEERLRGLSAWAERDPGLLAPASRTLLVELERDLSRAAAAAQGPPAAVRWGALLLDLGALDARLEHLRARAGRDARLARRLQVLRDGLGKGLRDAEDIARRFRPDARAVQGRLGAARRAHGASADEDRWALLLRLERGHRACRDARELAAPRVGRLGLAPGDAGDAAYLVLLAAQAVERLQRPWAIGLTGEPLELRERLRALERAAAALAVGEGELGAVLDEAEALIAAAEEAEAAAIVRERAAVVAREEAELESSVAERSARNAFDRRIRRAELQRRARYELLVLGQEVEGLVEAEDIDAGDPDDEIDALEEVTEVPEPSSEAPPLADAPEAPPEGAAAPAEAGPVEAGPAEADPAQAGVTRTPAEQVAAVAGASQAADEDAPAHVGLGDLDGPSDLDEAPSEPGAAASEPTVEAPAGPGEPAAAAASGPTAEAPALDASAPTEAPAGPGEPAAAASDAAEAGAAHGQDAVEDPAPREA